MKNSESFRRTVCLLLLTILGLSLCYYGTIGSKPTATTPSEPLPAVKADSAISIASKSEHRQGTSAEVAQTFNLTVFAYNNGYEDGQYDAYRACGCDACAAKADAIRDNIITNSSYTDGKDDNDTCASEPTPTPTKLPDPPKAPSAPVAGSPTTAFPTDTPDWSTMTDQEIVTYLDEQRHGSPTQFDIQHPTVYFDRAGRVHGVENPTEELFYTTGKGSVYKANSHAEIASYTDGQTPPTGEYVGTTTRVIK